MYPNTTGIMNCWKKPVSKKGTEYTTEISTKFTPLSDSSTTEKSSEKEKKYRDQDGDEDENKDDDDKVDFDAEDLDEDKKVRPLIVWYACSIAINVYPNWWIQKGT